MFRSNFSSVCFTRKRKLFERVCLCVLITQYYRARTLAPPSPLKSYVSRRTYLRDRHFGWRTQLGKARRHLRQAWGAQGGMGGGPEGQALSNRSATELLPTHVTTSSCTLFTLWGQFVPSFLAIPSNHLSFQNQSPWCHIASHRIAVPNELKLIHSCNNLYQWGSHLHRQESCLH